MPNSAKFLSLFAICCSLAAQNISTIAGGGPHNLPALQTGFSNISGLAVDSAGNVFVALSYSSQIWKIDASGRVNLFAGVGSSSYSYFGSGFLGDGGQALNATLCNPSGMAFDTAGTLYLADTCNGRIRRITTAGVISTVAGGSPYSSNGDGGPATSAYLSYPVAIALDASNNLYIADRYDGRIRLVSSATGIISTFAGTGSSGFSGDGAAAASAMLNLPSGLAVDSSGVVYIADAGNNRLRKVVGGIISTAAGTGITGYSGDGGSATEAQLSAIQGVSVDQFNDVFILEASDVREIPAGQRNIITFAGSASQGYSGDGSSPNSALFSYLTAMAFDSSLNLYLGDTGNYRIRKASLTTVSTFAGNGTQYYNGEGQLAINANLNNITSLSVDNAGSLYYSDNSNSIRKVSLATDLLTTVAGNGTYGNTANGSPATSALGTVSAVTQDSSGNLYFVESNRVRKVAGGVLSAVANASGSYGFSGDGGSALSAQFYSPSSLAIAQNGDLYIGDFYNYRVRLVSAQTGIITTVAGNGIYGFSGDGGLATNAELSNASSLFFGWQRQSVYL